MTRRIVIEWSEGQKVPGRVVVPPRPGSTGILLAHGAGAGHEHPFMVAMRDRLAAAGSVVLTFDYPYTAAGRGRPDRPATLLACHGAAAERLLGYTPRIVLAGKSMGGRIGSHLAAGEGPGTFDRSSVAGLVFLGYPLVAAGKTEPRNVDHLRTIAAPMLFVSGTRDPLGPMSLLRPLVAGLAAATLLEVDDGDHSLRVPKRSGRTDEEVLDGVAAAVASWVGSLPGGRPVQTRGG